MPDLTFKSRSIRWVQAALVLLTLYAGGVRAAPRCEADVWPLWQSFREHFVQEDGRVLDASTPQQHSTSEGQSYAMFFALVANDQMTFERLWRWSQNNLAAGDMALHLPGWQWGKDEQGVWRLLDDNSASDADLWFAYALSQAGRLWQREDYHQAALQLLANIEQREVEELPGQGKMLMPGFRGFIKPDAQHPEQWLINPSYMPLPLLRHFAHLKPEGPWQAIADNTRVMFQVLASKGFMADWVSYQATGAGQGRFQFDPLKGEWGSYDAIRVYLWAGMTAADDPLAKPMLASLSGMREAMSATGKVPEKVQMVGGVFSGEGGFGFSAALLPYFQAMGDMARRDLLLPRVQQGIAQSLTAEALKAGQPPYYQFMLSLFGLGHLEQRYRLLANGQLQTAWGTACGAQ